MIANTKRGSHRAFLPKSQN